MVWSLRSLIRQANMGPDGPDQPKSTTFRGYATPEWATHDSRKPPTNLAPAQFVCLECEMPAGLYRVDEVNWEPGLRYRLALSEDGLPLCSAEGLEDWAEYVATDSCGEAWQYSLRPTPYLRSWDSNKATRGYAPDTHQHPGDWRNSLMRVWRF